MPSPPQADDEKGATPPRVSSRDLLRGCREVIILHEKDEYRLRLTASNKLILVK